MPFEFFQTDALELSRSQREALTCVFLKYKIGLSQKEISAMLKIPAARVSRRLSYALQNMVDIHVPIPPDKELDLSLSAKLGIECKCVTTVDQSPEIDRKLIASLAAEYLFFKIRNTRIYSIGIGGGRTLAEMVNTMPLREDAPAHLYPLAGRTPGLNVTLSPVGLVTALCAKLPDPRTIGYDLPVGYAKSHRDKERLLREPGVKEVFDRASQVALAIVGIGSLETGSTLRQILDCPLPTKIRPKAAAVGSVGYTLIDKQGKIVDTTLADRLVAVDAERLKAICRTGRVMAVAGGRHKYEAIKAAVVGGYLNVLITDRRTGQRLLEEL